MITQTGKICKNLMVQTVPPAICFDPRIVALTKALAGMLSLNYEQTLSSVGIYYRIETLNERTLDILATDLHADWYDFDASLEEKRRLIRDNVKIHRSMGTVGELKTILRALYGDSTVEEWFQYNGSPYHFRVILTINDPTAAVNQEKIFEAISTYKPVRAMLDELEYIIGDKEKTAICTGGQFGRIITICIPQG